MDDIELLKLCDEVDERVKMDNRPLVSISQLATLSTELRQRLSAPTQDAREQAAHEAVTTVVAIEGQLELERVTHDADVCGHQYLTGIASRKDGAANIANVERFLELLNGKYVRVTIEHSETPLPTTAQQSAFNAGLEEAAKIADDKAKNWTRCVNAPMFNSSPHYSGLADGAVQVRDAIRSRITTEGETNGSK